MISNKETDGTQKKDLITSARLFFIGCGMGIADLVPGVSGGTIAFIANIYDEFLDSIKTISNTTPSLFLRGRFKDALRSIPFRFLFPLVLGIIFAVFSMANILSKLFEFYPIYVWAFFFGLVATSIPVVFGHVNKSSSLNFGILIFGAILAFILTGLIPTETRATPTLFFLSGAIAITAMILPGISGSFMLIVLGKYEQVLLAVAERNFFILSIFVAGIVFGLIVFSRLINYFLKKHHDTTISLLAGFILGSLRSIWPWKEIMGGGFGKNVLPSSFDMTLFVAIALSFLGALFIVFLGRMKVKKIKQTIENN